MARLASGRRFLMDDILDCVLKMVSEFFDSLVLSG